MNDTNPRTPSRRSTTLAGLAVAAALATAGGAHAGSNLPQAPTEANFFDHGPNVDHKVDLGMLLFYDKILSGNQNMACASCHHALAFTSDGLSLPVGEGGRGLGIARDPRPLDDQDHIHARVPRNSPHVFNVGAKEFVEIFWDGRAMKCDYDDPDAACYCGDGESEKHNGEFCSPAGPDLPPGLDNVPAVQAMFPVQSAEEMAGQVNLVDGEEVPENDIAAEAHAGNLAGPNDEFPEQPGVWERLAVRVQTVNNGEYVNLFIKAYPDEVASAGDITMVHIANALAAYEDVEFRSYNSPFDRYLRGDRHALSKDQRDGMKLFYGKAGCSECHSGPFQTDHDYHAIAVPQIGPGKGDKRASCVGVTDENGPCSSADSFGDLGRYQVTGDPADYYKFRTPPLRNVALTGSWGHDGAYNTLEAMVRHHLDPETSLKEYDVTQRVLPSRDDLDAIDLVHHSDPDNLADMIDAIDPLLSTEKQKKKKWKKSKKLKKGDVDRLIEFLHALTDPSQVDLRHTVPASVPSELPLAD